MYSLLTGLKAEFQLRVLNAANHGLDEPLGHKSGSHPLLALVPEYDSHFQSVEQHTPDEQLPRWLIEVCIVVVTCVCTVKIQACNPALGWNPRLPTLGSFTVY